MPSRHVNAALCAFHRPPTLAYPCSLLFYFIYFVEGAALLIGFGGFCFVCGLTGLPGQASISSSPPSAPAPSASRLLMRLPGFFRGPHAAHPIPRRRVTVSLVRRSIRHVRVQLVENCHYVTSSLPPSPPPHHPAPRPHARTLLVLLVAQTDRRRLTVAGPAATPPPCRVAGARSPVPDGRAGRRDRAACRHQLAGAPARGRDLLPELCG